MDEELEDLEHRVEASNLLEDLEYDPERFVSKVEQFVVDQKMACDIRNLIENEVRVGMANSRPSRILSDLWHLFDSLPIDKSHSLHYDFAIALRNAVFWYSNNDKTRMEKYLNENGETWEER